MWDENCDAFLEAMICQDETELMTLIPRINPNAYHIYHDPDINVIIRR